MPNIEEFSAGNIALRPQEIGIESTAATGRRMGVYGSQIGESYTQASRALGQVATAAENYLEHREINTHVKSGADLINAKNQSWSDFITGRDIPQDAPNRQDLIDQRINNPNVAKQWREQNLEPDVQQWEQSFLTPGGQKWGSDFANRYRQHMAEHTAADQSSMAGAVVQANLEKATDAYATATFNDPSSLKTNFDLLDHSLSGSVGSHPTLSPVESARISGEIGQRAKERLVQSAVQGAIFKGGNWQAIASDPAYKEYIKPAENAMFDRQARTYARMDRAAANQERIQRDYIDKQNFNNLANQIETSTLPSKAGAPPTLPEDYWDNIKELRAKFPNADPAKIEHLIDHGNSITLRLGKPEPLGPISHATTMELMKGIRSGEINAENTDPIRKAFEANNLNNTDYSFTMKEAYDRKTPEGERMNAARDLFWKRHELMIPDDEQLYRAQMAARDAEANAVTNGKPDPASVYNPKSPNYFGAAANMQIYKQPLQAAIQAQVAAPPRPSTFPADAQYDPKGKFWYVIKDGIRQQIVPNAPAKPAAQIIQWPTIPSSQ